MATRHSCGDRGVKRSVLWLRAGAVAAPGAAVITGQAVASAAPPKILGAQDSSPSAGPASKDSKSSVGTMRPRATGSRNTVARRVPKRPSSATPAPEVAATPPAPGNVSLGEPPVKQNGEGTVRTVTGPFTDRTVATVSDAAAVFNDLAESLGRRPVSPTSATSPSSKPTAAGFPRRSIESPDRSTGFVSSAAR